jgi:hypothetical protein
MYKKVYASKTGPFKNWTNLSGFQMAFENWTIRQPGAN